ncbi:hypothetical protein [Nitrosomonas sp.]|uniref:hypothetical protein n=1 Tax=Nitrosomonas sp. TaxID=42353 RepID=UPI0025F8B785|nr:hypothetical protein [Nitrosomonas sp.]
MNEQNKSEERSSLATPGVAIVAILLSLFAAQEAIFKPTRPPMIDSERTFSEDVRSRLWQDPFQAVEEHRKQHQTQRSSVNLIIPEEISYIDEPNPQAKIIFKNTGDNRNGKNVLIQIPELSDQFGYEYSHDPTRVCYDQETMKNRKDEPYKDSKILAHSIEDLNCKIKINRKNSGTNKKSLHVLAVMVPGGPYAEDKERRLRSRYAVISALTDLTYTPQDPEHIEFVEFKETCNAVLQELRTTELAKSTEKKKLNDTEKKLEEKVHFCHMGTFMPYEWFKRQDNDADKVLLLWLDNSGFTSTKTPLNTVGFLKKELDIKNPNSHFSIIGPAGSDALNEMYREVIDIEEIIPIKNLYNAVHSPRSFYSELENSYIYTPTATVEKKHLHVKDNGTKMNRNWLDERIVRTISTQDKLANTILCELALRGVIPYHAENTQFIKKGCGELSGFVLPNNHKPHHIVLIGEKDTFYSQKLTESLLDAIRSLNNKDSPLKWVYSFPYLRGLDGITSEHSSTQRDNKKKESQANKPNSQETKETVERPVGPSQLDYLLSLAEKIKQLDNQYANEGGIKAIGITGSDTYDKLLILQALRNKFPKTLFFTTDLDARLFYPTEIKWTRNLLVASPFGLELSDTVQFKSNTVQKTASPFRDNYQTSIYLSILLAMHCIEGHKQCKESIAKLWTEEPRMFEIGNHSAIDLSHSSISGFHPKPENAQASVLKNPLMQARSIELGPLKPIDIPQFVCFIIGIIFLTALLQLAVPRRYHINILAIAFVSSILVGFYSFILLNMDLGSEPLSFNNGISSWPAAGIRLLAICLVIIFLLKIYFQTKKNDQSITGIYLSQENKEEATATLKIKNPWSFFWIDNWKKTESNELVRFTELWCEYLSFRRWFYFVPRILILLLLYFTCIYALGLTDPVLQPSIPFRGELNLHFSQWIIFFAAFVFFILIFVIVDISHLTSHFVGLLGKGNVNLSKKLIGEYCGKFNLPESAVNDKILMDIIYKTTKTINGLIYYPFIFLLLFLLARNDYFDNWQFPPSILIIISFTVLIAWCSAFRLTRAAKIARKEILKRLNSLIKNNDIENFAQVKLLITEIENLKKGPFLPLTQHPMVLSWLIPFGSAGGLYLLEYFASTAV